MTCRDIMKRDGGNMDWCKPRTSQDGRITIVQHEGTIAGLVIDGAEVAVNPSTLHSLAQEIFGEDYSLFGGWTDQELITLHGDFADQPCCECPYFAFCEAMDEEVENKRRHSMDKTYYVVENVWTRFPAWQFALYISAAEAVAAAEESWGYLSPQEYGDREVTVWRVDVPAGYVSEFAVDDPQELPPEEAEKALAVEVLSLYGGDMMWHMPQD